jgi:hypothetical protein
MCCCTSHPSRSPIRCGKDAKAPTVEYQTPEWLKTSADDEKYVMEEFPVEFNG